MLGPAGFLQAWLAGGLREQVLACVGDLLQELEPDQLYNAADRQADLPVPAKLQHPYVSCVSLLDYIPSS